MQLTVSVWKGHPQQPMGSRHCNILKGLEDINPGAVEIGEEEMIAQLRKHNGLKEKSGADAAELLTTLLTRCATALKMDPASLAFLRNQLWRIDQLFVENELRIQTLDRELSAARNTVTSATSTFSSSGMACRLPNYLRTCVL